MKQKIFMLLALVCMTLTASAIDAPKYSLTKADGAEAHGTITFKVGDATVTSAAEGDVVTVTITPDNGWVVNEPTGQWIAAMAKSPQRRTSGASIDLLDKVTLTPVAGQTNQWTFTMQRANVEISSTYKKLLTNTDITIQDITAPTYTGQALTPTVTVKDGNTTLVLGTDYTVSYSNNVNAALSTATTNAPTVTITAVGNSQKYAGETTKTFTIQKKALTVTAEDKTVTFGFDAPANSVTYSGFVNNETASVLGGTLSFACPYVKNQSGVGEYTITPSGLTSDNYEITFANGKLTVAKKDLENSFIADIQALIYNGLAQQPAPVVTYNNMTLVKGTDYMVIYKNNVNVGIATVTITALNSSKNFTGSAQKTFTIQKKALTVKADDKSVTFGDDAPEYTVTYDGFVNNETEAVLGGKLDIYCLYEKNKNTSSEYIIMPSGLTSSNYAITFVNGKLTVSKKEMEEGFIADIEDLTYNGLAQKPEPVLTFNGLTLVENTDYTVVYANNKNAGTGTVTITGKGSFVGTVSKNFTILKKALTVTADDKSVTYGNAAPRYTATYDGFVNKETKIVLGGELNLACDYVKNQSGVGEYTITPSGLTSNNYEIAFVNGKLTVNQMSLENGSVARIGNQTYTGQPLTPAFVLTVNGLTLVENTDYTLAYSNNVNVGTATVTATGKGNYCGTKTAEFTIKKTEVVMTAPTAVSELVYNAQAQTLIAAGQAQGGEMQYSLDGENFSTALPTGTDAKTYTVYYKVVADANHNDVAAKSFRVTIAQAALTAATLVETNLVFNQQEQTAELANVTAGTLVVPEEGYEVSGNKATNVGNYTAIITGKGNFKGEVTAQWSIVADDANTFVLTLNPTEFVYDGTEKKPAVTVKDGETTLKVNTDYTLAYTNNVNAGTATVTATGKGNYSGTKTAEFIIKKAEVVMTAPTAVSGLVYNAQAQTLIAAGQAQGGVMQYSLDNESFSTALPVGIDAKEYSVFFKVVGDQNHNDTEAQQVKVTIAQAELTAVTLAETNFVYNQQEQTAEVASVSAGTLVVPEAGYEVMGNKATNVGTYTATITGKGNFKGEVTAQWSIVADDANTFVLTLNPTEFVYDGTEKTPAVVVKDGETTLVENTDYTLAYANNVNAGTATVTATGMGNYSGTKTAEFIIKKAEVVMTAPEVVTGLVYNAQAQTLIAAGSAEGGEMQYSLDGENFSTTLPAGTDAKEYSVFFKVVGDQNHNDTDAQQLKVTIEQAVLTAFELSPVKFVYNKQEQVAQVSGVKAGELVVTEEGYEVSGNKATEVGTYTVTVTGKGNFKGELKGQFTIVADKAALDNAIAEANDYYATIAEDYADIAAVLMEAINAAKGVKADEAATQQAVDDAVAALQAALQAAKDAVNDILSAIETAQTKSNDQWYDMKGRKLEGKPTKKGVYVLNGRKVVIK